MKKAKTSEIKTRPAGWLRGRMLILLLGSAVLTLARPAVAGFDCPNRGGEVDVMTANLYVGGDISRVMGVNPTDTNYLTELVGAVTGVYYEILASEPPVRMQTVARQIALRMPDLVAVEEASLIRVQSPGDLLSGGGPATNVVYDYLQLLLQDLKRCGAHYQVVATANEIDVELPMLNLVTGNLDDVRLTDREAILARTDLPRGQLQVSNPQSGNFVNVLPIAALGIDVKRGWCSVDVNFGGHSFRCVCTHLEEEIWPDLQAAQVQELLNGPVKTTQPVILLGDFNTDPLGRDGSYAYSMIPAAGFGDAWATLNPRRSAGGLTWGHDEFLADLRTRFDRRIDLVFYRGKGVVPVESQVVDMLTWQWQAPFWASDHAAVTAGFHLK